MTFTHSMESRVMVNDSHLSGHVTGFSASHSRQLAPRTTILDTGSRYIPGVKSGNLVIPGLFDSSAGGIHEVLSEIIGVAGGGLVTAFPAGWSAGMPAFLARVDAEDYTIASSIGAAVTIQFNGPADDGVDWGVSLRPLSAVTATGNGSSVDQAGATTGGGVASLHVTAVSGTTPSMTAKVQHSTNGTDWVDLITFAAATAGTWERKTVTGTVNRYIRVTHTVSGTTPSFTYAAAFARR